MSTTTDREGNESTTSTGGSLGGKFKQRNMNRYKTELCRAFEEAGHCKYGEKCQVRSVAFFDRAGKPRLTCVFYHPAAAPVIDRASQYWCGRCRAFLPA